MRRRELLRTTGFVGALTLAGRTDAAPPARDGPSALGWLPPSLVASDATYAVGVAPSARGGFAPLETGRRFLSLTTDRALLTVAVGADTSVARDRLRADGHDRRSRRPVETYGRSVGRRHRATALADGAVVTGVGPAAGPVVERVRAVARTGGATTPAGPLAEAVDRLGGGRHLSVDVRPEDGVAAVGDRVDVGERFSRLRTVLLPDGPGRPTGSSLRDLGGVDGVVSASTTRRGRATVREATVRSDALRDRVGVDA